jgi:ech hydrogenase subunit B
MNVESFLNLSTSAISTCWLVFISLVYVLTIKLRKSPFDLSSSHHAHQELVSGMTTEMCGKTLALLEITHWLETVLFLAWVGLFFVSSNITMIIVAILVAIAIWFLEIVIDANAARVKWKFMLFSAWGVAFVCGAVNLVLLFL